MFNLKRSLIPPLCRESISTALNVFIRVLVVENYVFLIYIEIKRPSELLFSLIEQLKMEITRSFLF